MTAGGLARRLAGRAHRRVRPTEMQRRIAAVGLASDDVAIDCGANIGQVTEELARTGALVHAFEPNPAAFDVLASRFRSASNIVLHPQAVHDHSGRARLYLHVEATRDPVGSSTGSSLLATKGNVDESQYVEVDTVDLAEFVLGLDRFVRVVKIDVEGVECPIVHRLLDSGAIDRIGTVFVEVHDRHIPDLGSDYDRLRDRIEHEGLQHRVLTDWE